MIRFIILHSGVLAAATQRVGVKAARPIQQWTQAQLQAGHRIIVPAIADYELRRKLWHNALRDPNQQLALNRLDKFVRAEPDRYLPMSEGALREAARLWGEARAQGVATAAPDRLDVDMILCAQVRTSHIPVEHRIVATTNTKHLARFVSAARWQDILIDPEM